MSFPPSEYILGGQGVWRRAVTAVNETSDLWTRQLVHMAEDSYPGDVGPDCCWYIAICCWVMC